jgi:hypothetical protein
MSYLRYQPCNMDGVTPQSETVQDREAHAVCASHAKSSAWVTGRLIVGDDLPEERAKRLFARTGTHPVAARFAQEPSRQNGAAPASTASIVELPA